MRGLINPLGILIMVVLMSAAVIAVSDSSRTQEISAENTVSRADFSQRVMLVALSQEINGTPALAYVMDYLCTGNGSLKDWLVSEVNSSISPLLKSGQHFVLYARNPVTNVTFWAYDAQDRVCLDDLPVIKLLASIPKEGGCSSIISGEKQELLLGVWSGSKPKECLTA